MTFWVRQTNQFVRVVENSHPIGRGEELELLGALVLRIEGGWILGRRVRVARLGFGRRPQTLHLTEYFPC